MLKFFVDKPVATAMMFLGLLVLGVFSFLNTPLELEPKEDYPQVDVRTSWTGVPPEIVQAKVTAPLEEALATVKGVQKMTSSSSIGSSVITLEFEPRINMEFATLAMREQIAKVRRDLPYGVRPVVQPFVPEDFRVRPFLSYTISGDYTLQKLRELVKDKLEFGIGSVQGVSRVDVGGGSDPEIRVSLDKAKLKAYNIQPYSVIAAIRTRLTTYPAGKIKKGTQEFLFKITDSVTGLRELGETPVATSGKNVILLRDVAEIVPTYSDVFSIHRINGQPTISLTVAKEKGTNTLKVGGEVKRRLEDIKKDLPANLTFKTVDDESGEIHKNLSDLYRLAGFITAIVFIMIFIVLRRLAPSLLILSSIAFSAVITFNLIYVFRISMNMLTLGALALGFGMFVDDSIVVFENILRLRERGMDPHEAALQGPREVFVAVLASTLTVISVFACFPYFQGRLKIYYLPLAIVISSALAASLLVSFSLIPALSPKLLERRKSAAGEAAGRRFERFLGFVLRHPVEILLCILAILYGSYKWFRSEVTIGEWFRWYSEERLYVYIGMPPGTAIEQTDLTIRKFEEKVLEQPYAREMNVYISAEQANVMISFPPDIERSYRPYALKEELIGLATQFAGLDVYVSGFDPQGYYSSMGAGTYYSSHIKFFGYNLKKLKDITSSLETQLKKNPRIKEVRIVSSRFSYYRGDSSETILKVDKDVMGRYDIDPLYLYAQLSTLLTGNFGTPVRLFMEGKDIAVSVKFPESDRLDLGGLQDALVRTRGGEYLRLGEISTVEERPIAGSIDRENQQFQQTIMWEFRGPSKAEENYRKAVFAGLSLPPGFSASMEETWYMTEKEKKQIAAAIAFSLVIIFMILAALYESFIHPFFIMLAVPLALIGVFAAFVVAKYPFDSSAYIGVILMSGIVVKNAILLVDHINLKRRQGLALREAVIQGTKDRIRPILMTTSTTLFGMMPMLLMQAETGVKRQIWSTLALSTVGGLTTSTLFLLVVIPVCYFYGDRLKGWVAGKFAEIRGT
ncbi:MAG: efflux RND transporter permease subunit [Candidatus Aminicenantales bacterium]